MLRTILCAFWCHTWLFLFLYALKRGGRGMCVKNVSIYLFLSFFSCMFFACCLMASMCVGFFLSSAAAKRTLGSGWSCLVTVHRSYKVTWYQLGLGCPTLFFPWSISVRSSGSRITFVPASKFPAVINLHKYSIRVFL